MAEVLSRSDLFSPCPRSLPLPCKRRYPSCVGFPRTSFLPLEQLRSTSLSSDFHGRRLDFHGRRLVVVEDRRPKPSLHALLPQMSLCTGKALKWWGKGIQPNMKEIRSAQDLVDSLLNAGNKLTVVDFFSPGCGGCKALHPKICQFAEMNVDVDFLQINYEEHKSMCYSLNVHVLPFFRFYRGAHGRLCSFSCTNATIKKFKDALAKHTPDRCSLGPAKGLEESELVALAANKDLSFNYTRKPAPSEIAEPTPATPVPPLPSSLRAILDNEEKAIAAAGR